MKWQDFKWVVENFGNILMMILVTFFITGSCLELIARLIPTEKPDSLTTKIGLKMGNFGTGLVAIGTGVTKFLDFVHFPNRLKK